MRSLKSCGVICFLGNQDFLLLKTGEFYGLPKGHQEAGETELETALRELAEETGISADQIQLDPHFCFEITYQTSYKRLNDEIIQKTVVIFLGYLREVVQIQLSEHETYEWIDWNPPHQIQAETIDPLLESLSAYLTLR